MRAKGFDALKGIKTRLAQESAIREKEEAARLERQEKAEDDRALFAAEMKRIGVTPVARDPAEKDLFEKEMKRLGVVKLNKQSEKIVPSVKPARPIIQRTPEKLHAEVGLSDSFDGASADDWGDREYISVGCGVDLAQKLSRGLWPVGAHLDLHGYRTEEARRALVDFILQAREAHIRCVRIVTGKGINSGEEGPVLKGLVRRWLRQMREVQAFVQAPTAEGGSGALRVLLAKKF